MLIRDLASLEDYADCLALQEATWGEGFSERVPTAILRVSQMIGGVAAGAFDSAGRMTGFVFGLTGIRNGELVHWSDMLAVRKDLRSQGIGEQLKQYQRDKVVSVGVKAMLWTFDPLQAGNAHFNINHLGAVPIEYVNDMYGNTGSSLHGAMPTDRFIVRWELADRVTPGAPLPIAGSPPLANPLAHDGLPVAELLRNNSTHAGPVLVQVPSDLAAVRALGNDKAMRWRLVLREVMNSWLGAGYRVTSFTRPDSGLPYYTLDPGT